MKKVFLSIMVLLIAITMASCESKPDASMLPEPEIEFRAVKGLDGTEFKIDVLNADDALYGFDYTTKIYYEIADASGNVLFTTVSTNGSEAETPVVGLLNGVNAGDMLICKVTFDYYGNTTSATVADTVV